MADNRLGQRCDRWYRHRMAPQSAIDGMFISIDNPTHSLRMGRDPDGPLLVALGPRFNTGQDENVAAQFRDLETWIRQRLPVGDTAWRWVNEDYDTADRLPLVAMKDGFYLATGFNGWGISNGTAAAMLIADCVQGRQNSWAKLYDDTRTYPDDFNPGGDSQSFVASIANIAPGQGGVIARGKDKIAVWKDGDGRAHALSASCTHEGCTVSRLCFLLWYFDFSCAPARLNEHLFATLSEARQIIEEWRIDYNTNRPHSEPQRAHTDRVRSTPQGGP